MTTIQPVVFAAINERFRAIRPRGLASAAEDGLQKISGIQPAQRPRQQITPLEGTLWDRGQQPDGILLQHPTIFLGGARGMTRWLRRAGFIRCWILPVHDCLAAAVPVQSPAKNAPATEPGTFRRAKNPRRLSPPRKFFPSPARKISMTSFIPGEIIFCPRPGRWPQTPSRAGKAPASSRPEESRG